MDVALVLHADHEFNASTFVAARRPPRRCADVHGAITGGHRGP
jgi:citrate synthase